MMNKSLFPAVFLVSAFAVPAQQVIENPATPISKTAGRAIAIKEIFRVKDEGEKFFFQIPRIAGEGPDKSVYVLDIDQILRFDQVGNFVRNYLKKGQGPGEMSFAIALFATQEGICVQTAMPQRIVWFDDAGELLKERPIPHDSRVSKAFQGVWNDTYYFVGSEFPQIFGDPQYVETIHRFMTWGEMDEAMNARAEFPVKEYIIPSGGGGGGRIPIAKFVAVRGGSESFYILHATEYLIKVFDVRKNSVVRTITRDYARVTPPSSEIIKKTGMIINNQEIFRPRQKYQNDISNLIPQGDRVWAVTSTNDAEKGTLIDVFDAAGRYIDAFFLKIPSERYAIFGEDLYTMEKNPDETYALKKYRIEWKD